jgi:tetratricopeptide (TPR) repeat protein
LRDENRRVRKFAEPDIPIEVTGKELEKRDAFALGTLAAENGEVVAKHLVCINLFLESDPERAFWHGQAAVFRAGRVAIVRERAGIAALNFQKYEIAQKELRAAIRISGSQSALPYLAQAELALGNPRKTLEIAGSIDPKLLTQGERVELRIAAAGARSALGQSDAAVVTLTCPELTLSDASFAAKLQGAYIQALIAVGRAGEAEEFRVKYQKIEPSEESKG